MLEVAATRGLLRSRGRQRTDSTKILADVRLLNRMEFVGEVLRTALEALAGQEQRWLRRYGERIDSWHGQLPGADREEWLRQVGADGFFHRAPARQRLRHRGGPCRGRRGPRRRPRRSRPPHHRGRG
ncbi:hypothetical protein FAF44_33105 [Nonomuraea sp. MG754425]|uniref:hypothetical protein n=1 Tax=Nonomuraea sp. MG754425 TaxID=2570319 RepID=UPI001F3B317B|nr:hypothetical protein [Nonomuraea sp. MG754425]MCF6473191.1 hypothetical protein [Nonomuraea sp. MG754425]